VQKAGYQTNAWFVASAQTGAKIIAKVLFPSNKPLAIRTNTCIMVFVELIKE